MDQRAEEGPGQEGGEEARTAERSGKAVGTAPPLQGEVPIKSQSATFGLSGSGLTVGRSLHEITYNYSGERPWPFTGGTIRLAAVDVSGEPYVDVEREAAAIIARA